MKALSKNDVKVLGVLVDWGCEVNIEPSADLIGISLDMFIDDQKIENVDSISEDIVMTLKRGIPPAGTPNAELTDEQKGLIQLLFEVEKALA